MADTPFLESLYGVKVEVSGEGPHVLVPAESGYSFRLFRVVLTFVVPTAPYVTARFRSNANDDDGLHSPLYVGDLGGVFYGMEPRRWFMTSNPGDPVIMSLSGDPDVKVGGFLTVSKTQGVPPT